MRLAWAVDSARGISKLCKSRFQGVASGYCTQLRGQETTLLVRGAAVFSVYTNSSLDRSPWARSVVRWISPLCEITQSAVGLWGPSHCFQRAFAQALFEPPSAHVRLVSVVHLGFRGCEMASDRNLLHVL